jgi:hypothetical protein
MENTKKKKRKISLDIISAMSLQILFINNTLPPSVCPASTSYILGIRSGRIASQTPYGFSR